MWVATVGAVVATGDARPTSDETLNNLAGSLEHLGQFEVLADESSVGNDRPFMAHGLQRRSQHRFVSTRPISESGGSTTRLRFRLREYEYEDPNHANEAWTKLLASADPDTGLTYEWDLVITNGARLYWLNAPCLLSRDNWAKLSDTLRHESSADGTPCDVGFECRCGHGCGSGE